MNEIQTNKSKITAARVWWIVTLVLVVVAVVVCIVSQVYLKHFTDDANFKSIVGEVQSITKNIEYDEYEIKVDGEVYRIDTWWNKLVSYSELTDAIKVGDTVEMLISLDNEIVSLKINDTYLFTTEQTIAAYTKDHYKNFTIVAVSGCFCLVCNGICVAKLRKRKYQSAWDYWFGETIMM